MGCEPETALLDVKPANWTEKTMLCSSLSCKRIAMCTSRWVAGLSTSLRGGTQLTLLRISAPVVFDGRYDGNG